MTLIVRLLLMALVVLGVSKLVPGVRVKNYPTALGVAVVYSLLVWSLKWLLVFLSFPLIVVTFGLFLLVVNAFLLWLTDKLVEGFSIKGIGPLAVSSFLLTCGGVLIDWLTRK